MTFDCNGDTIQEPQVKSGCPDFSLCLPWGGRLWQENGCLKAQPGTPPPDGIYDRIIIADGCIVGLEKADVALYVPPSCTEVPAACASSSEGAASSCEASPLAGNLYTCDASGRPLVRCSIKGGDGIIVSGRGTVSDPYRIKADISAETLRVVAGNNGVTVTGTGSAADALVISHKSGGLNTTVNGMRFDQYGHLVEYTEPTTSSGVNGIVPGDGIDVQVDNKVGIATISLSKPANVRNGIYQCGGYDVQLDLKNRIFNLTQRIDIPAQTYAFGPYDVELNNLGSVVAIADTQHPDAIHTLLPVVAGDIVRQVIGFTLRTNTPIVIDIVTVATRAWLSQIQVRLDGTPQSNILRCSTTATAETTVSGADDPHTARTTLNFSSTVLARVQPAGVWVAGEHELILHSDSGFPSGYPVSLSIRPAGGVDSVNKYKAEELWD
jgi:hypothetical protein